MVKRMDDQYTFEQGMQALEALVTSMESGALPLEESFQAYEQGVRLAAQLSRMLAEGDKRIVALKASLEGIMETDISDEVAQP